MTNPILELNDICYSYHSLKGETDALSHISFQVKKGEFLAIVGPSGCGKSTLLSIISGLLLPESGEIRFPSQEEGSTDRHSMAESRPRIGYMLQHDHLFEWRTIYRNVTLGLEINHQLTPEKTQYAIKLLKDYGLSKFKDKKPGELSGGMKQRAALIRTLVLDPEILLLDEPFSALDYQTRLSVSSDICGIIRSAKKTAVLVTHDLSEAISLADRILVLSGRPATIKCDIPVHLTVSGNSPLASRNAPEYQSYFNQLWKEISDENHIQNHQPIPPE